MLGVPMLDPVPHLFLGWIRGLVHGCLLLPCVRPTLTEHRNLHVWNIDWNWDFFKLSTALAAGQARRRYLLASYTMRQFMRADWAQRWIDVRAGGQENNHIVEISNAH